MPGSDHVVAGSEQKSAVRRLDWLDQVRAVAMYFVVVGHAVAPHTPLETFIYSFHMPLFFIISGMTFRPGRYAGVVACAIDKAKKLLVPYVLLSIITIPWWVLNWRVLAQSDLRIRDLLLGIAVSNQSIANSPANALWYLPTLFLLSVLFTALWRLADRRIGALSALVACCAVAGLLLSHWLNRPVAWHLPTVLTASLFYYAGFLFMTYRHRIKAVVGDRAAVLAATFAVLLASGTFFAMVNGKVSMHGNQYNSVPMFLLSSFLLSGAVILGVSRLPTFKWLSYVGANSLVPLAVHIPMLRTIQHFSPSGLQFTYAYPALVGAVVLAGTVPFAIIVNRFAPFLVAKKHPGRLRPAMVGEAG